MIAKHLGLPKKDIRMDLDAYSVVISTHDMERGKDAFRQFLQSFAGELPGQPSFPKWATGAKTKEGMFGCNGNECQHLPKILQGKEIMVIDAPVKIAIHVSCKKPLLEWFVSNKVYLRPAHESTGVCFDSENAANGPPFAMLVEGLIECCGVKPEESGCRETVHILHLGQMGFRLPLPKFLVQTSKFFEPELRAGIKVEVAQFDIAFEAEMERNKLIQASCSRKPQKKLRLMLKDTTLKRYPLHCLPTLSRCQGKGIKGNDFSGTIQVKKSKWIEGKKVMLPNEELDLPMVGLDAIDLFSTNDQIRNTREFINLSSSTPHSVKNYSTIAHALLQGRQKYPLTFTDMYGVGKRTFQSLQRMVTNLERNQQFAFSIAERDGFSSRFEVSVRPHFDDDLREKGHLNDILLVAILTLIEFCEVYQPKTTLVPLGNVQTEVMKLIHEARVMLKYAQGMKFENIFPSPRATEWLRSHMSQMLITIGICPSFHVKYINDWLKNEDRCDPFDRLDIGPKAVIAFDSCPNSGMRNLRTVLKDTLVKLKFPDRAVSALVTFVTNFAEKHADMQHFNSIIKCKDVDDPRATYTSLSFIAKHLLAYHLPRKIIPALLDLDRAEDSQGQGQRREEPDGEETDDGNDHDGFGNYEGEWELDTGNKSYTVQEQYQLPKNPLGQALYSLQIMRFSWDHERNEFNQMTLCDYILKCHKSVKLLDHGNIADAKTKDLLHQCAKGRKRLTVQELQHMCDNLGVCSSTRSHKSKSEYLAMMRKHYKFPSDGVSFELGRKEQNRERNILLNDVLKQDLVIVVSETTQTKTIQRFADNTCIDLLQPNAILSKDSAPEFETIKTHLDLYRLLGSCLNAREGNHVRQILQQFMIQMKNKPECMFLTSEGTTIEEFLETNNPTSVLTVPTEGKGHPNQNFTPEAILAITSLSYEKDIAFYNLPCEQTYFFINHQHRCVRYEYSSTSVKPKSKKFLIIRRTHDDYQLARITNPEAHHVIRYSVSPIGGNIETVSRLDHVAPNLKKSRSSQNFYQALSKMLEKLNPKYLPQKHNREHPNDDVMGLRSYVEDLSSGYQSISPFHGFHASITEQCQELNRSIRALSLYLCKVDLGVLSHHFICPIVCLKYPNLIIAVVQKIDNAKSTHFYAFDKFKQQSIYRNHPRHFAKLRNRQSTLYLYSNKTTTQYYEPGHDSKLSCYENTVLGMFSHVGLHDFSRYLMLIKSEYGLNLFPKIEEVNDYQFRPHPSQPGSPRSIVIGTYFKSQSWNLLYLDQQDVDCCAVVVIYPQEGTDQAWDACIIHHPRQDPTCARSHLVNGILSCAPRREDYTSHCIRGIDCEGCKHGFLMILYAYLGSQCSSVEGLERAMKILSHEEDLIYKTCQWIYGVAFQHENPNHSPLNTPPNQPPCWLKQITWNKETTFSNEYNIVRRGLTTSRLRPCLTRNPKISGQGTSGCPPKATSARTGSSIEEKGKWGGSNTPTKKRPAQMITPPPFHSKESLDTQQALRLAGPIFTTNQKRSSHNSLLGAEKKSVCITAPRYNKSSYTVHASVGPMNSTPPINNNASDVLPLVGSPHLLPQPPRETSPVQKKAKHGHRELGSGQSRYERRIVQFRRARTICFENVLRHKLCGSSYKRSEIIDAHAPGLKNPNTMCYMNAMIQLLFGMKCTRDLFLQGYCLVDAKLTSTDRLLNYFNMGGSIAIALHHLFQEMNTRRPGLSVDDFKEALVTHNMKFAEYDNTEQHDVHLLLGAVLDSLSETFQNFNQEDIMSSWFRNAVISEVVCSKCHNKSENNSDKNFVLAVGIQNMSNIQLCINDVEATVEDLLDCDKCDKKQLSTKTSLLSPAPVLMILLKRFNVQDKVKDKVTIKEKLYIKGAEKYVLAAIIIHIGSDLLRGHYYTLMRKGDQWLKYDDANVSPIDIDNASNQRTISENAFLVVYCASTRYEELIGN